VAASSLFTKPPVVAFRPSIPQCSDCGGDLNVQKTRTRSISTLHVGRFRAQEVFLTCKSCSHTERSEERKDNKPYFKVYLDLKKIIKDRTLWETVSVIEEKITVFEELRKAMRIAPTSGRHGLNDEGQKGNIRTIEKRLKTFRAWLTGRKDYPQNRAAEKMISQIDKYWEKLFADPITVETPTGPILVQPQRTNNILEQFFRSLKRANRRRTGNASSSRMLRTILAETPLVRNLENPLYTKILLSGKASLEEVFAEVDIDTFRDVFREAQNVPEKIPSKLKPLIAMPDFPEKLLSMAEKAAVRPKSNRILRQ